MRLIAPFSILVLFSLLGTGYSQQRYYGSGLLENNLADFTEPAEFKIFEDTTPYSLLSQDLNDLPDFDLVNYYQSQGGSGSSASGGSAAGAGAATDPSVPLTQLQFQNVFVPSTYDSSGYANKFIVQPVIPFHLNSEFIPYHIMRPTIPIIAPSADPDGSAGSQSGLGDTTFLDVFVHPMEAMKTNVGLGYVAILPTATHPQLGLREWQVGPAIFAVTKVIPKWNLGAVVQAPISTQSDAYAIQMQPIAVRMLQDEWYVGWGDMLWTLDNQNGHYNMPINARVGKVFALGKHKLNIFVEPFYTPPGLRKGPADEWGVKLNVTFLFPEAKFGPLFGCGCR